MPCDDADAPAWIDRQPSSPRCRDRCDSAGDGKAGTERVFLRGGRMAERLAALALDGCFTIGETGFAVRREPGSGRKRQTSVGVRRAAPDEPGREPADDRVRRRRENRRHACHRPPGGERPAGPQLRRR